MLKLTSPSLDLRIRIRMQNHPFDNLQNTTRNQLLRARQKRSANLPFVDIVPASPLLFTEVF